jgi:uncharacterized protein YkwD
MRRAPIAAFLFALSAVIVGAPRPATAAITTDQSEIYLMRWINQARADRGLVSLTGWSPLHEVSAYRARRMANTGTLNHTVGGALGTQLTSNGVDWYRYGETIAWSSSRDPLDAAYAIFRAWRGSSAHWNLLMSSRFNYIGAGLAVRSADGRTYGSVILTDSNDHSPPTASVTGVRRTGGDDLTWTWTGADRRLQTRTAGLRDFDVQVRKAGGSWVTRKDNTTARSLTLFNLPSGSRYELRVRATDRRGNVGAWTTQLGASIP